MRFMLLMVPKGYETTSPGTMPDPAHVAEMMKFNEDMQKAGILLSLEGLHPPSMGARVTFRDGKPEVSKGPFPGVGEVLVQEMEDLSACTQDCQQSALGA